MKKIILLIILLVTLISQGQITKTQGIGYISISTTQRDNLTVPAGEYWRIYNSTTSQYEYWNGGSWVADVGGTTSPLLVKGDIYTYDTDNARLNVGVDGQVLTANSTTSTGLQWSTPSGTGDVLKVGTPVNEQVGVWTGDGTLQGVSGLTYTGTVLNVSGAGTFTGAVTGSNLNITNWDNAYGWGDHSLENYITNAQETDGVYTASQAANIDAGDITNLGNLSGTNSGDQNLNDHFSVTANYTPLLADKDMKALVTGGNIILDDVNVSSEYQLMILNRKGTDITFTLGSSPQQYTDQYGTGAIPNLADGNYAYIELVADNVWSVTIGGEGGGTGTVNLNEYFTISANYTTLSTDVDKKGIISSGNITLDDAVGISSSYQLSLFNTKGSNVTFTLGAGQSTKQHGTGAIPELSDGNYAYLELISDNVWSIIVGGTGAMSGSIADTQIAVGDASNEISGTASFTFNGTDFYVNGNGQVTGTLQVDTDPNFGYQVGDRDYNDGRYAQLSANNTFTGSFNTFISTRSTNYYLGNNATSTTGYLQIDSGGTELLQLAWDGVNDSFLFSTYDLSLNRSIAEIDAAYEKSLTTKEWANTKFAKLASTNAFTGSNSFSEGISISSETVGSGGTIVLSDQTDTKYSTVKQLGSGGYDLTFQTADTNSDYVFYQSNGTTSSLTIDETGDATFAGTVGGDDAISSSHFITLGQLNSVKWVSAPASSTSTGTAGQIAYDANYLYICISTNQWVRIALAW